MTETSHMLEQCQSLTARVLEKSPRLRGLLGEITVFVEDPDPETICLKCWAGSLFVYEDTIRRETIAGVHKYNGYVVAEVVEQYNGYWEPPDADYKTLAESTVLSTVVFRAIEIMAERVARGEVDRVSFDYLRESEDRSLARIDDEAKLGAYL